MPRCYHYFVCDGYSFRYDGYSLQVLLYTPNFTKHWVELEPVLD